MTREDIRDIKIEPRGEPRYWNITMMVVPKPGNSGKVPCYDELVEMAETVLRGAKGLDKNWVPTHADVMAWSSGVVDADRPDIDARGIRTPHEYRVTLDMERETGDEDV